MEGIVLEGTAQQQQQRGCCSTLGGPWRYMAPYALNPNLATQGHLVPADKQATFLPQNLPPDPRDWSQQQVSLWLEWCVQHFSLPSVDLDNFHMNGRALCLLTKCDFKDRFPRAGDVLFNCLHVLLLRIMPTPNVSNLLLGQASVTNTLVDRQQPGTPSLQQLWARSVSCDFHNIGYMMQEQTSNGDMDSTVILSPAPSTEGASEKSGPDGKGLNENIQQTGSGSEEEEEEQLVLPRAVVVHPREIHQQPHYSTPISAVHQTAPVPPQHPPVPQPDCPQEKSVRLLWDFLQQLLNDPAQRYKRCISWKDKSKGVFKIVDPHQLAYLWGVQKNHLNMNFDKMSRALRYYYRVKILQKEPGERHCYRFLRHPTELRNCKQRSLLSGKVSPSSTVENDGVLNMSVKDEWPVEVDTGLADREPLNQCST